MEKRKNMAVLCLCAGCLCAILLWSLIKPDDALSLSERRPLAQKPTLTVDTVLNGTFMTDFESYTLDQFPLRDSFRQLKATVLLHVLGQKDNNGIFVADDYAAKIEYPLDSASIQHAADRFTLIYDRYLSQAAGNVYLAVIPDKSSFLAPQNGYPSIDTEEVQTLLQENMPYAKLIDLDGTLTIESYYRTDLHWRQEQLLPVANRLAEAMGVTLTEQYETITAETAFYGVYCGQSALNLSPDAIAYLNNETLQASTVYDYETDTETTIYQPELLTGNDPYAMFLSGSKSLLTITNPNADTQKELVIFRDSFASSLAPLLVEGYAKITLVDIRYLQPERLGTWLSFTDQDVLFLYSTAVLNNSETIK